MESANLRLASLNEPQAATLATGLIDSAPHGKVASRVKAVAHLRMTTAAAINLRDTLNSALAMGIPVQKPEGRAN